jgi:hypothetical protein
MLSRLRPYRGIYYSSAFTNRATFERQQGDAKQVVANYFFSSEARIVTAFAKGTRHLPRPAQKGRRFSFRGARAGKSPVTNYKEVFRRVQCKDPQALLRAVINDYLFTERCKRHPAALCAISETKSALLPKTSAKRLMK